MIPQRKKTAKVLDINPTIAAELAWLILTVPKLLNEDTMEYVYEMILEDPFNDDTRETVCGILMEALLSQFDVDGMVVCESLFTLLDIDKQQ